MRFVASLKTGLPGDEEKSFWISIFTAVRKRCHHHPWIYPCRSKKYSSPCVPADMRRRFFLENPSEIRKGHLFFGIFPSAEEDQILGLLRANKLRRPFTRECRISAVEMQEKLHPERGFKISRVTKAATAANATLTVL